MIEKLSGPTLTDDIGFTLQLFQGYDLNTLLPSTKLWMQQTVSFNNNKLFWVTLLVSVTASLTTVKSAVFPIIVIFFKGLNLGFLLPTSQNHQN